MKSQIGFPEPVLKSVSGSNLLIYTFSQDEAIGYQVEMLANNHVPGLLKSEVLKIDGRIRLSYDITSLIPLKKLFERRELGRRDFISLIKQIVSLLEGLDSYLLDYGGMVFNIGSIYANPLDMRLQFAYLPLTGIGEDLEPLKDMLTDSIMHHIRFRAEDPDNYVLKIFELLKDQKFDLALLKNYVNEMEVNLQSFMPENMPENKIATGSEDSRTADYKPEDKKYAEAIKIEPPRPSDHADKSKQEKKEGGKISYPARSYMALGGFAIFLILLTAFLFISGALSPKNPDFVLTLFGLLLAGGALGYFVYLKCFTPDKRLETKTEESSMPKTCEPEKKQPYLEPIRTKDRDSGKEPIRIPGVQYVNKKFSMPHDVASAKNEAASAKQLARNISVDQLSFSTERRLQSTADHVFSLSLPGRDINRDNTVILNEAGIKYPRLKGKNGSETIFLTKFPFMIGRLEEQVDYCLKNPAVGKLHAEITRDPEGYSITDINSRNGTMINGERLEPGKSYKLKNGDDITIANEEFVFFESKPN